MAPHAMPGQTLRLLRQRCRIKAANTRRDPWPLTWALAHGRFRASGEAWVTTK
eukprot:CAMPEP_0119409980 /NCGR_PEP_ID=MMETSP1335-20130426/3130_1 /TAXON_ID=259385 /ORGANISM="Chrysoculter rhomboideus, Strain RCC1486" /LENGTH=52 /DNA_ID=CAMNT_0007434441 /DNA_START=351 /DNA_END=509 /DNA_ORIENTATION=-